MHFRPLLQTKEAWVPLVFAVRLKLCWCPHLPQDFFFYFCGGSSGKFARCHSKITHCYCYHVTKPPESLPENLAN
jgi:hypothetical protein